MSVTNSAVEDLMGPLVISVFFCILLYGIFVAQLFYYWTTYDNDIIPIKLWVFVLGLLETAHTAMCMHFIYHYFVSHYGQAEVLNEIAWSVGASIIVEVLIVGLTQSFYVYRIWSLSQKKHIVIAVLGSLVVMRVGVSMYAATLTLRYGTWAALQSSQLFLITANIGWVLCGLADLMTTTTLIYYLYRGRTVALVRTRNIIRKLVHYSITTGAITVVTSMVVLITFNAKKHSLVFGGLLEVLTKLYANSVVAMLNARRSVGSTATTKKGDTIELSPLSWASRPQTEVDVIHVSKETMVSNDTFGTLSQDQESRSR
ncbi:hypothetical protein BDW22DRAFT_1430236 [Trametopsis cervina]|nr:hypothetical protein BDW22DRAFT_1430236 [Trametopsis cervina]